MLNYQGIADSATQEIIEDMKSKMMDKTYCINTATITVDVENRFMTVETMRKNAIGIEFISVKTVKI